MNENISKAAMTALDAILSSNSTTREPLRMYLLANLSSAPSQQYSFTVGAVTQILAQDMVSMHDFPGIFAALHYPSEVQAPILENTLNGVVNDLACRREMIRAGFIDIFKQALFVEPQPGQGVREFFARCVEVAASEIGRSGYIPDILGMGSHKDPLISVAILRAFRAIAVNGTEDDRVRLIRDGFLDESLRLSDQDPLTPGVLKLFQQSIPALSDVILRESKVTAYLLPLLWYAKPSLSLAVPKICSDKLRLVTSMRHSERSHIWLCAIFSQMGTLHRICCGLSSGPPFQMLPKYYASS